MQQWQSVGVKTELDIVPASKLQKDMIRPREYEALSFKHIIEFDQRSYGSTLLVFYKYMSQEWDEEGE